ncbi:MAG TPA: pyridoxamine 5'-phosphate oxidase family protein [Rhizobiaceae bacterium]|nr:pyridoxamine 5'-phosphate oxidase family protein [Rhizobiaceae bacterium]
MLNETARSEMDRAVLCWLATVSDDGSPNVSPKEIFAAYGDDAVVIADIASPVSVSNVRSQPTVCVSFVDIFRQRGFKITGEAKVVDRDDTGFENYASALLSKAGDAFVIRHVIFVQIKRVSRIWAPSYLVFPTRRDEERMEEAYRTYGVRPASP